jgi:hypothetical protein
MKYYIYLFLFTTLTIITSYVSKNQNYGSFYTHVLIPIFCAVGAWGLGGVSERARRFKQHQALYKHLKVQDLSK